MRCKSEDVLQSWRTATTNGLMGWPSNAEKPMRIHSTPATCQCGTHTTYYEPSTFRRAHRQSMRIPSDYGDLPRRRPTDSCIATQHWDTRLEIPMRSQWCLRLVTFFRLSRAHVDSGNLTPNLLVPLHVSNEGHEDQISNVSHHGRGTASP